MAKENYWVVKVGVMKLWRGLCQAMDFAALEKGKTMAKEYIEREATIELLRSIGSRDYRREKGTIQEAIKMVSFSEYTPAADVAPVVRCKDCRLRGREECAMFYRCECGEQHTWETDNDFCSWAKRRDRDNA